MDARKRIGVFGWGVVAPKSPNIDSFERNLEHADSWLSPFRGFGPSNFLVGYPEFDFETYHDWFDQRFPPAKFKQLKDKMGPMVLSCIGAFIQSLTQNAGIEEYLQSLGTKAHVYIGTGLGEITIAATETMASAAPLTPKADRAPTQAVPLPPARVATVSITGPDPPAARQDDFGLDLGGGASIDAVRQRWSTVKANFGPLLSGMHPLAAHDQRPGATGYRLVVGPLPNSVAASGLCAHFSAARTACRAVKFDGEQITQQ